MKIAVIADIHSNYHAFNTCINDAFKNGVSHFIFLGDYVSDCAYPTKTMDLIYDLKENYPCYFVRGNREDYMLSDKQHEIGSKSGSLYYTKRNLREKDLMFFKKLPIYQKININGTVIEIAHSTKEKNKNYFTLNHQDKLNSLFETMETSLYLTAHSHEQYAIQKDNKVIINPGSCGVPLHTHGLTQYAIIDLNNDITYELKQIPYPIKQAIIDLFESGLISDGKYWSLSVCENLITGDNVVVDLLNEVSQKAKELNTTTKDETVWKTCFEAKGLETNLDDILKRIK